MSIVLGFGMLLLCLIIHELGHYAAMRKRRVEVEGAGIGIPVSGLPYIEIISSGLRIGVHPLLIGAYVQPSPRGVYRLQRLPYSAQAEIYAAGPWANLVFGAIILTVSIYTKLDLSFWRVTSFAVLLLVLWYFGQRAFALIAPAISILSLGLVIAGFYLAKGAITGPIGTAGALGSTKGVYETLLFLFATNLSLCLLNLLPLSFLDGGRIWRLIVLRFTPKLARAYDTVGTYALLALFGAALIGDLVSLLF